MICRTKTAFCPSEPKYHRVLIDILREAKWTDTTQVKEEPKANNSEMPAREMISIKEFEEETAEEVQGHHF